MNPRRFDALTKALTTRTSRRAGLPQVAALALAAAVGAGGHRAAAQEATPAAGTCTLPLELVVRAGPDAGTAWRGRLTAQVDATGALTGTFAARHDAPGAHVVNVTPVPTAVATTALPVLGQATGHAISLLVTVAPGQQVYGVGVLEQPLDQCRGAMGGPFVGPDPADTGSWAICNTATCRAAGGTTNFCSGVGLAYFCAEPR
jgi:hypothetical protein